MRTAFALGLSIHHKQSPSGDGKVAMSTAEATVGQGHDTHKEVTIIVNGREKKVAKDDISFTEVVALSGLPSNPNTIFTVTYRRGQGNKEGTLVEGETVKVKEGMIFNVTATDKS